MSLIKNYLLTNMNNDKIIDRDQLQQKLIDEMIDGMDHKTMWQEDILIVT